MDSVRDSQKNVGIKETFRLERKVSQQRTENGRKCFYHFLAGFQGVRVLSDHLTLQELNISYIFRRGKDLVKSENVAKVSASNSKELTPNVFILILITDQRQRKMSSYEHQVPKSSLKF